MFGDLLAKQAKDNMETRNHTNILQASRIFKD